MPQHRLCRCMQLLDRMLLSLVRLWMKILSSLLCSVRLRRNGEKYNKSSIATWLCYSYNYIDISVSQYTAYRRLYSSLRVILLLLLMIVLMRYRSIQKRVLFFRNNMLILAYYLFRFTLTPTVCNQYWLPVKVCKDQRFT